VEKMRGGVCLMDGGVPSFVVACFQRRANEGPNTSGRDPPVRFAGAILHTLYWTVYVHAGGFVLGVLFFDVC